MGAGGTKHMVIQDPQNGSVQATVPKILFSEIKFAGSGLDDVVRFLFVCFVLSNGMMSYNDVNKHEDWDITNDFGDQLIWRGSEFEAK